MTLSMSAIFPPPAFYTAGSRVGKGICDPYFLGYFSCPAILYGWVCGVNITFSTRHVQFEGKVDELMFGLLCLVLWTCE